MKCKVTLVSLCLLLANNSWADQLPYYTVEELTVTADGASYGPFPSAISDDGKFIGTYSMKAALSSNIDIALPYTFNRDCQYDSVICTLEFSGSENTEDLSYENAYKQWRNAQSDADTDGYSRYFMANTLLEGSDEAIVPYALGETSSDVKVTDVTNPLLSDAGERYVIGYSSAPYVYDDSSSEFKRDFVRRAFIESQSGGTVTSLLPHFNANGGLTSAYKFKEVTYGNGSTRSLVIGSSSVSYPQDTDEYFLQCFFSDTSDEISTLNELVYCPGFDTQAWAWDVTNVIYGDPTDVVGFSLATHWLGESPENSAGYNKANYDYLTFSASALDINATGIAVGVSTFEYSSNAEGGHQRAIIMTPSTEGVYGKPTVITSATTDVGDNDDQENGIYNTWAQAITDSNIVLGNREFATSKASNRPFEFFVYDITSESIKIPLLDKKVLTTQQRLIGDSANKTGANSLAYDINESGFVVGEVDDYDQTDPVDSALPRSQTAFLYNNNSEESWLINDLICSDTSGVISSPYLRIRSARVIHDDNTVLAEGFKYDSADDYNNKINATHVAFKLTHNLSVTSPNDSPNCWDSELLKSVDDGDYERSGAASFWLWIFGLPLLFIRRFGK